MSEVLLAAAARTDEPLARVLSFSRRFGRDTTALAMHAALPLGLSPELVHLLRANFVPRAPFIAEADLLLSPLCAEVGGGMYEMDADVRELLLAEMARTPGYGRARLRSVARFLGVWAARALDDTADPDVQGHLRVQQWVALAYADPARAAEELAAALRGGVERADRGEVARVARLTTVLSAPLAAQLELRRYAGTVERIAASGGMASGSGEVAVGRERLPGIERVARLWRPGAGHATGEEMEAAEQAQRRAGGEGAGAAPVEGGYRVARVLVTGQAGVGKTALIASLLEQPFQPAPATHGVVLSRGEVAPGDGFGGARDVVFHEARMMDGPLPLVAPDPAAVLVVVPQTAPAPYDEGWVRGFRGNNPDTPVFVVATGADLATTPSDLGGVASKPGVAVTQAVSALTGAGIEELKEQLRLLLPWHRLPAAASREEVDRLEQEIGLRLQSPLVASYHDVREWISPFLSTHGDVEAALARALQCLAARDVVRVVGDPPSAVVQADAYTRCLGEIWRAAGAMQHDQRSLPSVPLAWLEERFSAPEFRGFLDADPTPGVLDLVLEDLARGRWGYRADTRRGAMVVVPSLLRWRRHEERPDLEMIVSAGWPGTVHDVWVLLLVHLVDLGAVRVIDRQGALVDLHNGVLLVDASERNGMAEITLSGTGVEDVDALIHLFRDRVTAYVPAGVRPEFIDVDPEGDQDVPSDAVLSRTCVSVLPFGKKQIGERDIDFDAVWRELFQPAIKATELPEGGSLKPVRYNAYGRRGNRLPGWIQNARLLLVDITGADPRRIVELGLLALRSQRIFLFHERSSPVPSEFDGMFVGLYDHPDDPRRLAAQRAMVTAALTEALLGAQRAADTTRLTEALRSPGGTRRSAGGETRPRWIYLSYASEDHEFAERFAEALKRRGLPVWIDLPSRLAGGDDFTWQISAVIAEAFVFVPLLSRNLRDARGRYFHMEWDRAMEVQRTMPENRRFIIPLRLDDEISWTDESVPPRLTELQWINARTDDEIEAAADQLRELYRRDQLARDLSADAGDAPQREGERDEPTTVEGSIYLSYAGEDHDRAQRLADALRQLSLPVFMSAEETLREDVSEHAIRAAVRNASVFVPFLSKNAQARKEGVFRLEWHAALDHAPRLGPNQRFIVPVVLDDELVTTRDIPNEFAHLQWMSARTAAEFESVASLLRDLYRSFRLAQARPSA